MSSKMLHGYYLAFRSFAETAAYNVCAIMVSSHSRRYLEQLQQSNSGIRAEFLWQIIANDTTDGQSLLIVVLEVDHICYCPD
jgi:hypothetical protein